MIEITIRWTSEYELLSKYATHFGDMRITVHKRKGQLVVKYTVWHKLFRKVAVYTIGGVQLRNKGFNSEQITFIEKHCKRHRDDIIETVELDLVKPTRMFI